MKDKPVWALGAMSGTSLDGVDAAMVLTDGHSIFEFGDRAYRPYSESEKQTLRAALGQSRDVTQATEIVENAHAELLSEFSGAEIVGFHGQTLSHRPLAGKTFQAGNGSILAEVLNCPVVWDFRSADMELGGQGAPLAPFFHFAAARWFNAQAPLAILNIGGVANLTYVDPSFAEPTDDGALLAFDTGPGNAQINDFVRFRGHGDFDRDGQLAAQGEVNQSSLANILAPGYFNRIPPKSLDRDDFSFLSKKVADLSDADGAATLAAATSGAALLGLQHCPKPPDRMLVSGGGRHNPVIMDLLRQGANCAVEPIDDVGLDGDMLEAQAFAHLAVRVMRGFPTSGPSTTGVSAAIGGGRISKPGNSEQS